ncbi:hypothetical protein ACHAWO_011748 [Cyclotella atomus]|uniref:Uncharacterized protein n=1 Tax=Cyclotella atomus TaxID=382360 RepID=A0ABD3MV44_9STRA
MKTNTFLILASVASTSAQLNRVADRQLLRVRRQESHSNDDVDLVSFRSSKASKVPSMSPTFGAKASKPPHSHVTKPTHMPTVSPIKSSKAAKLEDDAFDIDTLISLSMETADSLSMSVNLSPEFGEWDEIELSASMSMSVSMSMDPEFSEWDTVNGFEWSGESMSMSI